MSLVYIVIPAYNESGRISRALLHLRETLVDSDTVTYKMVIIDDGSRDTTYSEAVATHVGPVLRFVMNRGQGAALMAGNEYAVAHGADVIVHFDSDDQHDPKDIQALIAPLLDKSYDVVIGSRFMKDVNQKTTVSNIVKDMLTAKGVPTARKILGLGSWIVNTVLSGLVLTDIHNGLRAFTRETATKFKLNQDRYAHASEYQQEFKRLNLTYKEVPMTVRYGHNEKESQGFFDGLRIIKELLVAKVMK